VGTVKRVVWAFVGVIGVFSGSLRDVSRSLHRDFF
jgi:hypothetical protein